MSTGPGPSSHRRRPGDRVVRIPLTKPEVIQIGPPPKPKELPAPQVVLAGGFAVLIAVGSLLLLLPFATAPGQATSVLDALFTATSAVCVTGLVVVDTGTHWSPFGQAVILVLIQLGGLGFMTASTSLFLAIGRRTSLRERLLLRETLGAGALGDVTRLVRQIAIFALVAEAIGFVFLFTRFVQVAPLGTALWWSLFHAISSFNQAGFDLFGNFQSLTPFRQDAYLIMVTSLLIIAGGLSYSLFADAARTRSFGRLALNNKLVLVTTTALFALGTLVLLLTQLRDPTGAGQPSIAIQSLDAFFLSVSARSAGFSSLNVGALHEQSLFFIMGLMFIGGASGSTAGGIKVNTFSLLLLAVWSAIAGRTRTEAFGREVPQVLVYRAMAVALLALGIVFVSALILTSTETAPFIELLFEVVSAWATCGLSAGVTPSLSPIGRVVIILLMFIGRLGPLTLMIALTLRQREVSFRYPTEEIRIG